MKKGKESGEEKVLFRRRNSNKAGFRFVFTIDFEAAKTYRENVGMDPRFRRNAWHDLQVEVYI